MSVTATQITTSIRVVGGLLPADMITRIATGKDVSASTPADYHVVGVRSVKDAAERHWDYLKGAWRTLRDAVPGDSDPRGLAIENWLLPLFDELGYGRLTRPQAGITADDGTKVFPVSHGWQHLPIHLVPWEQDLDRRHSPGALPPQSMVQECLNRTVGHLWAVVSNGSVLRILRDTTSLTGAAYLEVDLAAMFDGELFDEFVLLYRLLHVSRFEIADGAPVSSCLMERWRAEAIEAGTRALDQLRDGVKDAIVALGTGFLKDPANTAFRENFDKDQAKRALLRLVYRLLFWFVAEDRDALHAPDADEKARQRYARYFSARRLRAGSLRGVGTAHGDQWQAVRLILKGLGAEAGLPHLGLPGLGGIYDDTPTDALLADLDLSNEQLLAAIRSLSRVRDKSTNRWRRIDYRNLGAEELGAIYESLLELVPDRDGPYKFVLREAADNERKSTGSFYTPTPLIDCLLDSTLDPVLDDATKEAEIAATSAGTDTSAAIAEGLLQVTVCDPACGSGHFLVAAARRIAKRVAAVREHNPEPTIEALRTALRDVIARCVYGVDVNEMAVELAKVSLWLEALDPGKPLSFLDAHIKHGNALIGATPKLIDGGIPDAAFKAVAADDPVWGDDRRFAASLARANEVVNPDQFELFSDEIIFSQANAEMATELARIAHAPDGSLRDVHQQAAAYREWAESDDRQRKLDIANAWCAAFVWRKHPAAPPAIVNRVFRALSEQGRGAIPPGTATELDRLRDEYGFFHWHLEFPGIFQVPHTATQNVAQDTGWTGGFTCVLGNPPWERIKLQEQEFFASRDERIANAPNASARKNLIKSLPRTHPELYREFKSARRHAENESHFLRGSGRYKFTARGDVNTYAVFAETDYTLIGSAGRVGVIVPTGIATDATTQYFFKDIVQRGSLASLYDFENRKQIFPAIDSRMKFSLLTLAGAGSREPEADFAFFLHATSDLDEPNRRFTLTPAEIALLNPNTGTCPIFRSRRDAEITLNVYRGAQILLKENDPTGNPWGISFLRMFDISNDADLFRSADELEAQGWHLEGNAFTKGSLTMLPLYQGVMATFYDHRAADVVKSATATKRQNQARYLQPDEKKDPFRLAMPAYWVDAKEAGNLPTWMIGFSSVTSPTNERTFVPYPLPRVAVGNSTPVVEVSAFPQLKPEFLAMISSFAFDFMARQKVGGVNLNFFIVQQLPTISPEGFSSVAFDISSSVLELVYTAIDMADFAKELDDDGAPFKWDEERRFLIQAELDALFFRLYGIERNDVDYIMETFPIVKRKDVEKYGEYRTKNVILDFYDRMAAASAASVPYQSPLTPTPGYGARHV